MFERLLERREMTPFWWGVLAVGSVIVAYVDFTAQASLALIVGNALFMTGLGGVLFSYEVG
jgi:hypothetical protein